MIEIKERLLAAFDGMDQQAKEEITRLAELYESRFPAPKAAPVLRVVASNTRKL